MAQFFVSLSFPFLAVIGHLPGCVVYQGQFAEIIASLQSGNGPFAMYHNVDGAFEENVPRASLVPLIEY